MSNSDASNCYHVLVKLPDGRFFDGGNGMVTEQFLRTLYSDMHVEEMKDFDFALLDKRSYGLGRTYSECPNYSDEFTQRAIERRLSEVTTEKHFLGESRLCPAGGGCGGSAAGGGGAADHRGA